MPSNQFQKYKALAHENSRITSASQLVSEIKNSINVQILTNDKQVTFEMIETAKKAADLIEQAANLFPKREK